MAKRGMGGSEEGWVPMRGIGGQERDKWPREGCVAKKRDGWRRRWMGGQLAMRGGMGG